ncbi:MAG: helix-turn-helix domain-containing protein [Phycisphaera sp.]|nr:helix-turn-helix domain-containing protein [Phycisphaera sp.]
MQCGLTFFRYSHATFSADENRMSTAQQTIGTAIQTVGDNRRVHVCTGTYGGDIPDKRFRFNILKCEHSEPFPMHGHEYSELVIVLGGRATHRTDFEDYPIAEGDVFVINGDHRHGFDDVEELSLCNIQYDPEQFFAGQRELEQLMGFHALFDLETRTPDAAGQTFRQRLCLSRSQLAHVRSLLEMLREEFAGSADGRQTVIRSTFMLLVTYLARAYDDAKRDKPTPVVRMASVVAHIRKHFRTQLRIDDLAAIAHLSPSQFQRTFKKVYGTPPLKLIGQLRIEEACELLRDPTRDVAEIGAEVGYCTGAFFSTQFKRATGVSPTEYRKAIARDGAASWSIDTALRGHAGGNGNGNGHRHGGNGHHDNDHPRSAARHAS